LSVPTAITAAENPVRIKIWIFFLYTLSLWNLTQTHLRYFTKQTISSIQIENKNKWSAEQNKIINKSSIFVNTNINNQKKFNMIYSFT
jgi:hypothetical protein